MKKNIKIIKNGSSFFWSFSVGIVEKRVFFNVQNCTSPYHRSFCQCANFAKNNSRFLYSSIFTLASRKIGTEGMVTQGSIIRKCSF